MHDKKLALTLKWDDILSIYQSFFFAFMLMPSKINGLISPLFTNLSYVPAWEYIRVVGLE